MQTEGTFQFNQLRYSAYTSFSLHRNIQRLDDCFSIPCVIEFGTIVSTAILSASVLSAVSDTKLNIVFNQKIFGILWCNKMRYFLGRKYRCGRCDVYLSFSNYHVLRAGDDLGIFGMAILFISISVFLNLTVTLP